MFESRHVMEGFQREDGASVVEASGAYFRPDDLCKFCVRGYCDIFVVFFFFWAPVSLSIHNLCIPDGASQGSPFHKEKTK